MKAASKIFLGWISGMALILLMLASPIVLDSLHQYEPHQKLSELHGELDIGMDLQEVRAEIEKIGWNPSKVRTDEDPFQIVLLSERYIFPHTNWNLTVRFDQEKRVESVWIGSTNSWRLTPSGAPPPKEKKAPSLEGAQK